MCRPCRALLPPAESRLSAAANRVTAYTVSVGLLVLKRGGAHRVAQTARAQQAFSFRTASAAPERLGSVDSGHCPESRRAQPVHGAIPWRWSLTTAPPFRLFQAYGRSIWAVFRNHTTENLVAEVPVTTTARSGPDFHAIRG